MPSQITATDLYITGNVTAGGTIQANYADLAEFFICHDVVKKGDPVSLLGPRTVGKYIGKNYIGIRSSEPAVTMGGELKIGIPIAFIGSVPVNVKDKSIKIGNKLILKKDGIYKKRWYNIFYIYVGIAQEPYNKGKVIALVGVK